MMLCGFLPALNIVSERIGTIEQINVTPVSKFHFHSGQADSLLDSRHTDPHNRYHSGMVSLWSGSASHLWLLYFFALLFIIVISGMGLVVSNYSQTMQQAMFVMFFFVIIIMLMSGLFTPINSMPE